MLEQAADVILHRVAHVGVAVAVEDVRLALPDALVSVHPGAVVAEQRLGHERRDLAVAGGDVLHQILVDHDVVRGLRQGVVHDVDLTLPCRRHLMVVLLDLHAELLHLDDHLRANVAQSVHRRRGEVALLVARPEARAQGLAVQAVGVPRVPDTLVRVHAVMGGVGVLGVAGGVEDEELRLRPPVALVADAGGRQVGLRLLGYVPGVAAVVAAGQRIADVAYQAERLPVVHRVHRRGAGVRDQEHVALVYRLEPPDARPVEAGALFEQLLRDLARRNADVLQRAGNVRKLQVDNLDPLVIDQFYHFFWRHASRSS